jgi:hypothetical protein
MTIPDPNHLNYEVPDSTGSENLLQKMTKYFRNDYLRKKVYIKTVHRSIFVKYGGAANVLSAFGRPKFASDDKKRTVYC